MLFVADVASIRRSGINGNLLQYQRHNFDQIVVASIRRSGINGNFS